MTTDTRAQEISWPQPKETRAQKLKQTSAHAAILAAIQTRRQELERLEAAIDAEDGEPLGEQYYGTETRFLRDTDLARIFGVNRTSIWRWTQAGILPQPHRFSPGCSRWPETVVADLVRAGKQPDQAA